MTSQVQQRLKKLEILPLNKLVYNRIGIMMYKYFNNLLPPAINDLYVSNNDVHTYSTRQKHFLYINKSNIHVYANKLWNHKSTCMECFTVQN